jgi:hypothetical protein
MRNYLMAIKIEVDPMLRAAALFTAKQTAVEFACGI